jgi:hypothetical protein
MRRLIFPALMAFAVFNPAAAQTSVGPARPVAQTAGTAAPSSTAPTTDSRSPTEKPASVSAPAALEGRQFGQHVSGMAPEHPRLHGSLFGECVSELAITGDCPHHDDEE